MSHINRLWAETKPIEAYTIEELEYEIEKRKAKQVVDKLVGLLIPYNKGGYVIKADMSYNIRTRMFNNLFLRHPLAE